MCYRVVVAAECCDLRHPIPGTGRLCYRQCRQQAEQSSRDHDWNRICDHVTSTVVTITDLAEETLASANCPVCTKMRQDTRIRDWKHHIELWRQKEEDFMDTVEIHNWRLQVLSHENIRQDDMRILHHESERDSARRSAATAQTNILSYQDRISTQEMVCAIPNDAEYFRQAREKFVQSGARSLPFFHYNIVSISEEDTEEYTPMDFPDQDGLLELFKDDLWIVPAHVNL